MGRVGSGLHSRSGSYSVALAPSVILLVTEMAELGGKNTPAPFLFFVSSFSPQTSTAIVAVAVDSETMAAEAVVSPPASGTPPGHRLADDGPVAGGWEGRNAGICMAVVAVAEKGGWQSCLPPVFFLFPFWLTVDTHTHSKT